MTPRGEPLKNVGASVRARLTDKARTRGDDVQLFLLRFAIERLIYRLAQSKYRDDFILKGAMLFSLWAKVPYRGTGDLDLLGKGDPAPERIISIFRELCSLSVPDDGLAYDPESVTAEQTRPEDEYQGVRVELNATLAGARLRIQIDIGFGDVVMVGLELRLDHAQFEADRGVEETRGQPQHADIEGKAGQQRRRAQVVVADVAVETVRR